MPRSIDRLIGTDQRVRCRPVLPPPQPQQAKELQRPPHKARTLTLAEEALAVEDGDAVGHEEPGLEEVPQREAHLSA